MQTYCSIIASLHKVVLVYNFIWSLIMICNFGCCRICLIVFLLVFVLCFFAGVTSLHLIECLVLIWNATEPMPICETVEVKKMRSVGKTSKYTSLILNKDKRASIIKELCTVAPHCSLAKHKRGRGSSNTIAAKILCIVEWARKSTLLHEIAQIDPDQDCCRSTYYEKICKGNFANIAILSAQNKVLWGAERKFRITGSRCYELYTYSKDDWDVKTLKYFWPKNEHCLSKNLCIQHGVATEGEARSCYQTVDKRDVVETGLIISNTHPWLAFSPDGVVMENGRPIKLLEIKCPFLGKSQPIEQVMGRVEPE